MASVDRTAYPHLRPLLSAEELQAGYDLTEPEQHFIGQVSAIRGQSRVTKGRSLEGNPDEETTMAQKVGWNRSAVRW